MNKIIKNMNNRYTNVKTKKDLMNFKYMSIDFERRVGEFVQQVKGTWTEDVFSTAMPKMFVDHIRDVQEEVYQAECRNREIEEDIVLNKISEIKDVEM